MTYSLKTLRIIGLVAVVLAVNLFIFIRIQAAYKAYHWQNYIEAYPIPGPRMTMLSQSGGSSYASAVQGKYAYVGVGPRLEVLDVTNPAAPVRVWQSSVLPGIVYDVAVSGNHVYIADSDGGFLIMDISNPVLPNLVSARGTPDLAWNVAVSGNYAYLASGSGGLRIYNISDPGVPIEVGVFLPPSSDPWNIPSVRSLAISGSYAYLAVENGGLIILDISSPTLPKKLGGLSGSYKDVSVSGTSAYLLDRWGFQVIMVDVANPASPIQKGFYYNGLLFNSVAASGSAVYVAYGYHCTEGMACDQTKPGMGLIDFSDPAKPQSLAFRGISANPQEITVVNGYAYLASGPSGLSIVNLNQASGMLIAEAAGAEAAASGIRTLGNYRELGWEGRAVVQSGSYAYVAGGMGGLRVLDVSTPQAPREVYFQVVTGQANSIALAADKIYLATDGGGLYIYDISVTPAAPVQVGYLLTTGSAAALQVVGNTAYLADGYRGLRIIDVSNPANPLPVSTQLPSSASQAVQSIAVSGSRVYAGETGNLLKIWDVTTPAFPVLQNTISLTYEPLNLAISGSRLYVACGYGCGLGVYDLTSPTSPTLAGHYASSGYAYQVFVEGNTAYLANARDGMVILDVTTPANITSLGKLGYTSQNVFVASGKAYISSAYGGLLVADVSNPSAPQLLGVNGGRGNVKSTTIVGTTAYVSDGYNGVRLVDVSNPAEPVETGFYETPGVAVQVAVRGQHAFVADYTGGLRVLDVSDPAHPNEIGHLDTPGEAQGITAGSSGYAYIADGSAGLRIVNINDPAFPAEAGSILTPGFAMAVAVSGPYAYVADYGGGLRVINVSNPVQPIEVSSVTFSGILYDVAASGGYLYAAAGDSGLHVLSLANPAHPVEVGTYPYKNARAVTVIGSSAYVADQVDGGAGMSILNVTDPAHPVEIGFYLAPGARAVTVSGTTAYVSGSSSGLWIADISQPAGPTLVGTYHTVGKAYGLAIKDHSIFVAEYDTGMSIMDIADPQNPRAVGHIALPGKAYSVVVSGNVAYVAAGYAGLRVIDLTDMAHPAEIRHIEGDFFTLVLADGRLYAGGASGFQVIDITAPANPTVLGTLTQVTEDAKTYSLDILGISVQDNKAYILNKNPHAVYAVDLSNPAAPAINAAYHPSNFGCFDISVSNGYAYLACSEAGLKVVDFKTNPAAPALAGSFPIPGRATQVRVFGNHAYVAGGYQGGVRVVDVTDVAHLKEAAYYNTPGTVYDVVLYGRYVYAADRDGGLAIFKREWNQAYLPAIVR